MKRTVLVTYLLACGCAAFAQAPTVPAASANLSFTYLVNSGAYPKAQTVTATFPSTVVTGTKMDVDVACTPPGWLSVTPSGASAGPSPLTLTVNVNPTSLSPGSYPGSITIKNHINNAYFTVVNITFAVTSPPSVLQWVPASVTFDYTSGTDIVPQVVDISTTGDIIPFTVSTAVAKAGTGTTANWLRVRNLSLGNNAVAGTSTSGVAAAGSDVKIEVSVDKLTLDTLDSIPYTGTVTIKPVNAVNGSGSTVAVTLNITAGHPILCTAKADVQAPYSWPAACEAFAFGSTTSYTAVFPASLPALPQYPAVPPVPPVITLYGDNFFASSSHAFILAPGAQAGAMTTPLTTTWVSRSVLKATIPVVALQPPQWTTGDPAWSIVVVNGASGAVPSNTAATSNGALFLVTDPTWPSVQAVVNAASYLPKATQLGTGGDPVPGPNSAVSPREIITIFGQNLGSAVCINTPSPKYWPSFDQTNATCKNIRVDFSPSGDPSTVWHAPLIMGTANQINAIVPLEVTPGAVNSVTLTVTNDQGNGVPYQALTVVAEDPGIFTFGGTGTGQAAVLNFDATTGTVTVNGKSAAAARSSAIEIFATGLGDLAPPASPPILDNGEVATGANKLNDDTYRVLIGGQSAAVFYAGTAGNSVAGLVQINAIVPPNATTGAAVPLTVEIGPNNGGVTARRSQQSATIAIK